MKKRLGDLLGGLCKLAVILILFFIYIAILALTNLSPEPEVVTSAKIVGLTVQNFIFFIFMFLAVEVIYGIFIKRRINDFVNKKKEKKQKTDKTEKTDEQGNADE